MKGRTFEVPVDARQRETCVAQFEDDVGLVEQRGQHALELQHVSREPRWWHRQRGEWDVRQHRVRLWHTPSPRR